MTDVLVDIGQDLEAATFDRGFVQKTISGTWLRSDLRIVMPKLRTDPTEFAHLSLSTLEGSTGAIDDTFYAGRQVDFRSATMMLLDLAPPQFAIVDAWAPVAALRQLPAVTKDADAEQVTDQLARRLGRLREALDEFGDGDA